MPIVFASSGPDSSVDPADPDNDPKTIYDLVVLVVDEDLDKDTGTYFGLKNLYKDQDSQPEFLSELDESELGDRILRYADDLRAHNEMTDVKIIFYDKSTDSAATLAKALENLYYNGDGEEGHKLAGVVLIGEIPLPVVNKNGNKYVSIFPYADFSEKAYILNEETNSFERNNTVHFPKPEIWHGVIRAPTNNVSGKEKLAEFFDKNHLYYEGEPMYAKFDKKIFFGDLVHEEEQINEEVYQRYVKYLEGLEDSAYFRFNKFWAAELSGEVTEDLEFDAKSEFAKTLQSTNPMAQLPDIYSKPIIEQFLFPYYRVLNKYVSSVNDFADYTARYEARDVDGDGNVDMNVDSMPAMIAIKDEYTKVYLKSVNDALEEKVNEVVDKIEEPLPLLEYAEITASVDGEVDRLYWRFHYKNEEDQKLYVNGIDADILNSAKQCSVYLGSTKSQYFDDLSMDFNPKAVGGEYSILTRAIRSDDFTTAMPVRTSGVNTRLLSPTELSQKTEGKYAGNIKDGIQDTGAIVEDNPAYGVSAFLHNTLYDRNSNYKNPFEYLKDNNGQVLQDGLQENDVIVRVNGQNLSYAYTFDQAIEESYKTVKKVVDAINDGELSELNDLGASLKVFPGQNINAGSVGQVAGYISVQFYRKGQLMTKYFSFTVDADGKTTRNDPEGNPEIAGPQGGPEIFVVWGTPTGVDFNNADTFEEGTQGAIFTLYENKTQGYSGRAYDQSAGCNANSTAQNSDRCFGMIASMPVLDAAGALAPVKMEAPGVGDILQFPEKVKRDANNLNSGEADDYDKNVESYQFPEGAKFDDVDEVYYNSCYSGLPTTTVNFSEDANPFAFPLDADSGGSGNNNEKDFYGRLLNSFGTFVGGALAGEGDYEPGTTPAVSSNYSPKSSIWLGLDGIGAEDVVFNEGENQVTLEVFAKRYGLFDGLDNDGDGIIDYEWNDGKKNSTADDDGVFETKFYDFEEADKEYGIAVTNIDEVARKLFSHDSKYTIPYGVSSFPYRDEDGIFENVTLTVDAKEYKKISSMILHNEPTDHTISQQVQSMTAFSLPIDNPRYVAFQTKAVEGALPVYPEAKPKNSLIDVEEIEFNIENNFGGKNPHYYPGESQRIDYINLFDEKIPNMAQLEAYLHVKADELAALPGSYRAFENVDEDDYTAKDLSQKIFDTYFSPVIKNNLDSPVTGFELEKGSTKKIHDALVWKNLSIDAKHEYVLKNYLNGDAQSNAYADDNTLFPGVAGFDTTYGYEAAYLVLDGEKNYFDMNFNKDLTEEEDPKFNPLSSYLAAGAGGDDEGLLPGSGESGEEFSEEAPEAFQFVWIEDFLKEITRFVNDLEELGEFGNACAVSSAGFAGGASNVDEIFGKAETEVNTFDPSESQIGLSTYTAEQIDGFNTLGVVGDPNPFVEAEKNQASGYIIENNSELVADGASLMKVEARILSPEGGALDENVRVRFSISEPLITFEGSDTVQTKNGLATIYLRAGKKTGNTVLKAEVVNSNGTVNGNYNISEKEISLVAGQVAKIEIKPESTVLVANNQSKSKIDILLRDKFGNLANNSFEQITLFSGDKTGFNGQADINGGLVGTQLATFEGRAQVDLLSKDEIGSSRVTAVLTDYEMESLLAEEGEGLDFTKYISVTKDFKIVENLDLKIELTDSDFKTISKVAADGKSTVHIGVKLLEDGKIVNGYNGPVIIEVLKENLGGFVNKLPSEMISGQLNPANVTFRPSTTTGEVEISVNIPGFVSDTLKFETTAGKAKKIELITSEAGTNTGNEVILQARLMDANGNLAEGNNGTAVIFSASEATKGLVSFSATKSFTLNGVASTSITAKNSSGVVNLVAEADGLQVGLLSLPIKKRITSNVVKGFAPRSLYVSLLGGDFGQPKNNLAETVLNSGQVQAVSAVTANSEGKMQVLNVDGYGRVELLSDAVITNILPATNSFPYQKIVFSDDLEEKELASLFLVPKVNSKLILLDKDQVEGEGIYVKKLVGEDAEVILTTKNDGLYIERNGNIEAKIDKFGRISLNDDAYELRLVSKDEGLASGGLDLVITRSGVDIALVSFIQKFANDAQEVEPGSKTKTFSPGVYLQLAQDSGRYTFEKSFSGNSSNEPKGFYLLDTENELDSSSIPGFGYTSLDNASNQFGLGFESDNKHMLLFSSGNSVGESYLPYASEVGIVYGDPMVKVEFDEDLKSDLTGYTKDLGKAIFAGQEEILELIDFDYNGDGLDDLLLVYEDGLVRLLENEISNKRFRDKGYVANVYNGIFSAVKIDVNNDSYDDLLIGTKESCNVGEECLALFRNFNGNLERVNLDLALEKAKAYEMKAADMDTDGCEDLVVSDSAGNIKIFYNENNGDDCLGLSKNYEFSQSFGYTIKGELNLVDNLFVNYPGMPKPKENAYIQFVLQSSQPGPAQGSGDFDSAAYAEDAADLQQAVINNDSISTKDVPPITYPVEYDFIHIKQDPKLALSSTKQAKDMNGGNVGLGDLIEYTITLKNSGGSSINNLILSDITPLSMDLELDSLKCLDFSCPNNLQWVETGTSLRSHAIQNISVPANGSRIISYKMRVNQVPEIHFDLGNDFTKYPANNNDDYLDIMVRAEANQGGVITYLYSTGYRKYKKYDVIPGANVSEQKSAMDNTFEKLGLPKASELLDLQNDAATAEGSISGSSSDAMQAYVKQQFQDKDYNGCIDSWSDLLTSSTNAAQSIADGMEAAINKLRCSGGGCLPNPYNYAFLAPDGVLPGPGVPGTAVFAAGTEYFPYFATMWPSSLGSTFRLYVSPTTTLGIGTAICSGLSYGHGSPCWAFAVPGGIPGVCQGLQASVDEVLSFAKNAIIDPAIGQAAIINDGEGFGGTDAVNLGGSSSFGEGDNSISAAASVNIRIPGFPSVLTNWLDKQIDEIYSKLLDFPTIYFILPDFSNAANQAKAAAKTFSFRSFHDFATSVSSFPFIEIEGKEIVIKVPSISPKEIAKYKYQAQQWIKYMEFELEKYKMWDCDLSEARKTLCDKILLDINNLISSVKRLLDLIDKIGNLPKDILTWRNAESKYATQIICYLDAVMTYTGGYINRQEKIVKSWLKAGQDAIKTFKDWQIIMDVVADYQQSCDQCKNDRFSELGLLLESFIVVPEPPIIPLPKWPDLVVDFSEIKTGVKILWPDVVFRPEPIILPNLPTIKLPDILPTLDIDIDEFVAEIGGFQVPNIPNLGTFTLPNLPDLPPLPLPKLPDLPKPPRIPALPDVVGKLAANLKPIFKILCLLKLGIIPVPEAGLATEIETLTQPSVQAVLPIIKNLGFQWPAIEYSYVEQIKITGKLNFEIDTSIIYLAAEKGAKIWNDGLKSVVGNLNQFLALPYGEALSRALQNAIDKATKKVKDSINEGIQELEDENDIIPIDSNAGFGESSLPLALQSNVEEFNNTLNQFIAELEAQQEIIPENYYLTANQNFLDPNDPLLHRTLAEVEADIQKQDFSEFGNSPNLQRLADLRDGLIVYTKGLDQSNALLDEIDDFNQFNKILVESDQSLKQIAALSQPLDIDESGVVTNSFFGESMEENLKNAGGKMLEQEQLLAAAIDFNNGDAADLVNASNGSTPPPIGFYVAVADGANENVLNYTKELKKKTNVLFNDVDDDSDHDIVYSMGGDVYWKENYNVIEEYPEGALIIGSSGNTVNEFAAEIANVQGISVPYISNEKFDLNWMATEGAVKYEVVLYHSIYADDENVAYKYSTNEPNISIKDVNNDTYYAKVFAYDSKENRSVHSDMVVISPQSCADTEAPFPIVGATEYDVSIFKDVVIDASSSFDTDGKIQEYYLEVLPFETKEVDPITKEKLKTTDFKKIIYNDLQPWIDSPADDDFIISNDRTNPILKVGPFTNEGDIGKHEFILHVVDQSGRSSEQKITINVFAPEITLDATLATKSVASGETEPKVPTLAFSLFRTRYVYRVINSELKLAPRTDKVIDSKTFDDGSYSINNLKLEDMILVENSDGKIVAEIHPQTGNVGAIANGHEVEVNPSSFPSSGTNIKIKDQNGGTLGTIYIISDANVDVQVFEEYGFSSISVGKLTGVNIDDIDPEDLFEIISLPANDAGNPGGAIVMHKTEKQALASIDTVGNILLIDKRMTLTKKANDHVKDPLILELRFSGKVIAEIYIDIQGTLKIVGPNDIPLATTKVPSEGGLLGTKALTGGGSDLKYIFDKVSEGFEPDDMVRRKDFIRVLLKMLCIEPRNEAYAPYDAGSGYSDVEDFGDYHADIKEATLLGLVDGYKGEPDEDTGLFPFKPDNRITRAEAVKIILKALEIKAAINLKGVGEGDPWYGEYMKAGQNLTKYLKSNSKAKGNFIITSEESLEPYKEMTFEELVTMVERVLDTYNCFTIDSDDDGMADFCEEKYDIKEPNLDQDDDGLINSEECYYKLDPTDKDTDKGGVFDGPEMILKTNPLDASDDKIDEDKDGLSSYSETTIYHTDPFDPDTDDGGTNDGDEVFGCTDPLNKADDSNVNECRESVPGLYLVPPECNTCPCISTFLHKADIIQGDTFFPIISKFYEKYYELKPKEKTHIFKKGNSVEVQSVNK